MMKKYKVLGIMSGTSMDGIDYALCEFVKNDDSWECKISAAETIPYSNEWEKKLGNCHNLSGYELLKLDMEYGYYIGENAKNFLKRNGLKADFISSHGHTVFHNPKEKVTFQIGNGAAIASASSLTTVCNFRILDVALHGQGAPLVPVGDAILFSDYDYCLNLGGFANISFLWYKKRVAFDICPVNIAINNLSRQLGKGFDEDGNIGRQGKVDMPLLKALNSLPFYKELNPKSLSREWTEEFFFPLFNHDHLSIHDKIRTLYEHIAFQISRILTGKSSKKILITGGGAHNKFLIELIKSKTNMKITIPDKQIINFKEALIFAFLGILRMRNEYNCLSSVTGSRHDNIGGVIYRV